MDLYQPISATPKAQILTTASAPIANAPVVKQSVPASLPPVPAPTIIAKKDSGVEKAFILLQNISTPYASTITNTVINSAILPTNTYVNPGASIFSPLYASSFSGAIIPSYLQTSTIVADYIQAGIEISTALLSLDQAFLTANGTELLLNGIPVATTLNLSSLTDWAIDPAISTVNLNNNDIINGKTIYAQDFIGNLLNVNQAFISDLTVYQQTTENFASTITIDGRTINCSTLNVNGDLFANNGVISTLTVSSINVSGSNINPIPDKWAVYPAIQTVNLANNGIYSGSGNSASLVADTNLSLATNSSNITITAGQSNLTSLGNFTTLANDTTMTASGGINIANETDFKINSSNGNRGRISLNAGAGFNNGVGGEIRLNATGGVSPLCNVGSGGLIELNATSQGIGLTSAIKFNASGINSYAGAIPSIGSLAGYNFIYGTGGVNICAGLPSVFPNVPFTTYIYGTAGVSLDGTGSCEVKNSGGFECATGSYLNDIQPFYNGLTTPPDLLIHGRTVNIFDNVCVSLSNVKNLDFQSNVLTRITNVDSITMSNGSITGVSNINLTNINGSAYPPNIGPVLNTVNVINMIGGAINGLATVNGLPYGTSGSNVLISTLNTASISSLTVSSINGFAYTPGGGGGITTSNLTSTVQGLGTAGYLSSFAIQTGVQSITGSAITMSNVIKEYVGVGLSQVAPNAVYRPIEVQYQLPVGTPLSNAGYVEMFINGSIAGSGQVGLQLGTDIITGKSYIGSIWDGYISMPLQIYGASITFDSDAETLMYMDGNAGGSGFISTGVAFSAPNISTPTIDAPALTSVSSINGVSYPIDPVFGEFLTTTTITVSGANTPTVIPMDTFPVGNGVNLDAGDVEFLSAGLYEYSFNIQLDKTGGGTDICDVWLRLNGNDIADTASRFSVVGTSGLFLAVCSFIVSVNAGDKIATIFASPDNTMSATFFPAWSVGSGDPYDRPAVPANIIQVRKIR